jgi:hypothetical protein
VEAAVEEYCAAVLLWTVTVLALVLALGAWLRARVLGQRLTHLTDQYWDLRYQHGQLRAQVQRLDPDAQPDEAPAPAPPSQTFIPLSTLKRGGDVS